MTITETLSTPVTDVLNNRVSIRNFNGQPVSDAMLRAILNAARRSPTSSNTQTYSFVVVRDPAKRDQLATLAGDQQHIRDCDVYVAICADIARMMHATAMHGTELGRNLENSMVAIVDAAIVGQSVQLAAESFGLGAVMIGGMRNDPRGAADLLGLPEGVFVVYGMSIGWPDEAQRPPQKPRLPEELVIHYEQYDTSDPTEKLQQHDAELAAHYRSLGRNLNEAAWTGVISDKFSQPRRPYMREVLEGLGFRFD